MSYNLTIFNAIYGLAHKSLLVDTLGIFLADYLPYALGLVLLFLLFSKKDRPMAILALTAGLVARFLVKSVIVFFYQLPRPYISMPSINKLIFMFSFDNFQSFPSSHALFFFAVSTAIYCYHKKLGIFFFICSVLMGLARIFVGVHWPLDILAGAVLGILTGWGIYWLYKKYTIKKTGK